jgi:DNA polymerase elongation subunit (family B)
MHIGISSGNEPKLDVRLDNQTAVIFNGLSDGSFGYFVSKNKPDVTIIYADHHRDQSTLTSVRNVITKQLDRIVIINVRDIIRDISLVEIVEKAQFSYLPLKLASTYGMLRLIDSRVTFELIKRNFVVPKKNTVAQIHEEIRTLENIIEMDKAGMIISPKIGLHENIVVLDFNDEYANIITRYNISYENIFNDSRSDESSAILPSIVPRTCCKTCTLKTISKNPSKRQFSFLCLRSSLRNIKANTSMSLWVFRFNLEPV